MLTGKCLKEFEKWKLSKHQDWVNEIDKSALYYGYSQFRELPFNMQYGVYVDFFDENGIHIDDYPDVSFMDNGNLNFNVHGFCFDISIDCKNYESDRYKTRPEARKLAIIKANELFNAR